MKLRDIFNASSATIFDYARGIFRYTPKQQKEINDLRKRLQQEGVDLPPPLADDKKHGDGR